MKGEKELKTMLAVVAAAALLLPLVLVQAHAQMMTHDLTVTLKVTNTKTGSVQTKVWKPKPYTFGDRPIDVPDFTLKKIMKSFNTDNFAFTFTHKQFEGEWMHFKVEMVGTPLVGTGLSVKFM